MNEKQFPLFDLVRSLINWFLVGILTMVIFFPILLATLFLFPFDRSRKHIHPLISFWAKAILVVCPVMRVHVEGTEHLDPNKTYVLVANHQSIADIIAVLHLNHPFKFVAKQDLFWIPFMGWGLSLAGYIPLIRGDHRSGLEAVRMANQHLERSTSILLFPEGTRSPNREIQDFKVGAFKLAAENKVPIVPIVIHGTHALIPKGSIVFGRRVEVIVRLGKPQGPYGQDPASIDLFCKEARAEMISSLNTLRSDITGGR